MNRRGFIKMLGITAPAALVAPKYFFAPIGGWHSDVIISPHGGYATLRMRDGNLQSLEQLFTVDDSLLRMMQSGPQRVTSRAIRVPLRVSA